MCTRHFQSAEDSIFHDHRYAVLALGIGANAAVFTLLNTLLLKPLPYPNAKELVFVERKYPQDFGISISIPKFNMWRNENKVLNHLAAFDQGGPGVNLRASDVPELVRAVHVSFEYFPLFGATTTL